MKVALGFGNPLTRERRHRGRFPSPRLPEGTNLPTPAEMRQRLAWGDGFLKEAVEKGIALYDAARG